jgi:hypothetical protein
MVSGGSGKVSRRAHRVVRGVERGAKVAGAESWRARVRWWKPGRVDIRYIS